MIPKEAMRVLHALEERNAQLQEEEPDTRFLCLPPEAAHMLHNLVLTAGARRALEIGTSAGYSGVWIAAALAATDGHLLTLEQDERKAEIARDSFVRAGVAGRITLRQGDARRLLPAEEGPFDFVFVDAWKDDYPTYLDQIRDKLIPGAVVVADNVVSHGHREAVARYIRRLQRDADFQTVTVPIGAGIEYSVFAPQEVT